MKKRFLLTLVWVGMYWVFAVLVSAQNNIQILDRSIESKFRDHITAYVSAQSQTEITEVEFFYRVKGQAATSRNVADFEAGNAVQAQYKINQKSIYFPPGTQVEYWWKLTDADDNTLKTDRELYLYLDNRYDFKTLSNERVTLYWYQGADSFGQTLFDQANKALDQLEKNTGISLEQPVKIFIYGSHADLMSAIAVGAQEWTGGQAFTNEGVVVMGVSPVELSWGLKATTHELTHLVIHQATDNPYGDLPRWLDEGLAVYNEDPERLDSQFRDSFEDAVASDSLMTLQTLSSTFPADSEVANLAYGQSGAVVKFIIDTYGPEAMKKLLEIFSEGALSDDALEQALGVDTRGLDNAWRASLGLPPLPDIQPESSTSSQQEMESEQVESEPVVVSTEAPQAQPTAQASTQTKPEESNLPCLAGLLPVVILGVAFISNRKMPKSFKN